MFGFKKLLVSFLVLIFVCMFSSHALAQEEDLLEMSLEDLLDMEVETASKTKEKISEIPASVVVITRKEIEKYGYSTLEEILENITGLYQIDECSWTGSTNYGVRGFFSAGQFNDLAILVNGVNQVEDMYNSYPIVKFGLPVEAIDRIEIVRGPMSVIYGNGAFFGAINIITNQSGDEQNNLLSSSLGTQKTYKIFTRVAGISDDFRYFLNGAVYGTDGLDLPYKKMASTPFPEFWGLNQDDNTKKQLENHTKYVNFSGNYKDFSLDMTFNETEKEILSGVPSVGKGSLLNATSSNVALGYQKDFSKMIAFDTKFIYHSYRLWSDYEYGHEDYFGINSITTNSYEIEANIFVHPLDDLDINAGLLRKTITNIRNHVTHESGITDGYLLIPVDDEIITNAFFMQINYNPFEQLKLISGVRLEKIEEYTVEIDNIFPEKTERKFKFDTEIIPRAAVIYALNHKNVFKFLYGQAIKQPAMGENADLLMQDAKDLESAEIKTFEINYMSAPVSDFIANLSIFRNELDNLISREMIAKPDGELFVRSSNAGKMITHGIELGLKLSIFQKLEIDLSGSYQKSSNERKGFEDIDLGYAPEFLGYCKASYQFPHRITLAVSGNYVDQMLSKWEQSGLDPEDGKRLGDKIDAYFTLNANLRIDDLYKKGLFLNIKGSNLFDEEIHYPTTAVNAWADKGLIGKGQEFLVTVGWKF